MDYINKARDQLNKKLQEKNACTDVLNKIEAKTNVKKEYMIYGLLGLLILYLIVGWGGTFLANVIGFLYPAYCSIKAIESAEKDDDTKWLTYWVVYAAFSLIETFADIFLFWIPLYALLKCAFLIFLMVPGRCNGSIMLYQKFIRPYVLKYEKEVDSVLDEVGQFADKAKNKAAEAAVRQVIPESHE